MSGEGQDRFALGAGRPRPEHRPRGLKCSQCGSPLEVADEATQLVVCEYCGAHLDVGAEEQRILGAGGERRFEFPLELGDSFRWQGARYEVVARLALIEDGDPSELTREYLLYHPRRASLWLSEYQGRYSIAEKTHVMPKQPALATQRGDVVETHDDRRWMCAESGVYELAWVDGALPWLARPGDQIHYVDLVDASGEAEQYEVTTDGGEIEYSTGRALPVDRVRRATGRRDLPGAAAPAPHVAVTKKGFRQVMAVAAVVVVVNAVILVLALGRGEKVLEQKVTAADLTRSTLSRPFEVGDDGNVVKVTAACPQLDNAWMALDLAVVRGEDTVLHVTDADVEYYHGRDADGSWSEGSRSKSVYVEIPRAGSYRLLVHAVSDRSGVSRTADRAEHDLHLEVVDGAAMPFYPAAASVLSLAVLVISAAGYHKWRSGDEEE